jgi:hypothetical protein
MNVKKVIKPTARKAFDAGKTVYLQSSNMPFKNVWQSACPVTKDFENEKSRKELHEKWPTEPITGEVRKWIPEFDRVVNEFEYYNCCNERGKYAHFYIEE